MDCVWRHWFLQDLRLSFNRLADESLLDDMTAFAEQYNIWTKRPKLQVPEALAETCDRIERLQGRGRSKVWEPSFALG